jgi:hypothetical protein
MLSLCLIMLAGVTTSRPEATPPVTLASLLAEMTDRAAAARFPSPAYRCSQASSYDRASDDPDDHDTWFANADVSQYMRAELNGERKEWVMMDRAGPGAVVRIWSANPKGVLRIYIDGATTPAIEAPMTDALGGKWVVPQALSYEASKGWNLYLPIPYARRCKITSDSDGFYYQVNYRTYAPGTPVESFWPEQLSAAGELLRQTAEDLLRDRAAGTPPLRMHDRMRQARGRAGRDERVSVELPAGPQALSGLQVSLKADDPAQALRSCVVEAEFDGLQTIWCPAGDFFGAGPGISAYQDWYRSVAADGTMRCAWVMPYAESGRVAVHNLGAEPVEVEIKARCEPWAWCERSMHFHAIWRQEHPVRAAGARGTLDFNYVTIEGRGVYVADTLSVMNPVKEWWGEGDEKIYVDGERFPSHFGTGTEDYYGYAWCSPELFQRPFHAQPRCDGQPRKCNWGRTTVTRSRSLDAIPFTSGLRVDMEVWHWRACDVEYATTAYFYARPGAAHNRPPLPERAAAALVEPPPLPPAYQVAGAIECEGLEVASKSEGLTVVRQEGWPEIWSGQEQLWVQGRGPGDYVELRIPVAGRGRFGVTLHATKSWDYGIVRFSVNGQAAGADVDLFNTESRDAKATGPIELGVFETRAGALLLRAEVVGGHPRSEGTKAYFGLDCVVVTPAE